MLSRIEDRNFKQNLQSTVQLNEDKKKNEEWSMKVNAYRGTKTDSLQAFAGYLSHLYLLKIDN